MILTREKIHGAGNAGIGFNRHQLALLGVNWPPKKGWLSKLIGKELDDGTWEKVVKLRGVRRKIERAEVMRDGNYIPRLL